MDPSDPTQNQEVEVRQYAYVYAIGDQLQTWVSHLCFHLGESDYYRLNEILQILNIWQQEQIYQKRFIDLLKRYLIPQYELAKSKYECNQAQGGLNSDQ